MAQHKFCSCKWYAVWDKCWLSFLRNFSRKNLVNRSKFCQNFRLPKFCVVQYNTFVMSPQHSCYRRVASVCVHDGHVCKHLHAYIAGQRDGLLCSFNVLLYMPVCTYTHELYYPCVYYCSVVLFSSIDEAADGEQIITSVLPIRIKKMFSDIAGMLLRACMLVYVLCICCVYL